MKCFPYISILILFAFACNTGETPQSNRSSTNEVRDVDGNVYHIVKIKEQFWLRENLKVRHYRNGDPIPNLKVSSQWLDTKEGAYCSYGNDENVAKDYGYLYNWYTVDDSRGLCPTGWRVPSDTDFAVLSSLYGGAQIAGAALKEKGNNHWKEPLAEANDTSGFSALAAGQRGKNFDRMGRYAFFWNKNSCTEEVCIDKNGNLRPDDCAHECSLCNETSFFNIDWGHKNRGMSVRCIKDDRARH